MRKEGKIKIKDEKEILINLFIEERLNWFVTKMKELGFYTTKWGEAYKLYLDTRIRDGVDSIEKEFIKRDIGETLKELMTFLIWQDSNFADNDTERFLYSYEEE
ncbi:hypothetical protein LIY46_04070 [Fusobacterium varium]|uniref:hypothetical protein n=1 Tax=Fusobacterium TaxID=848 RepID=UPI0030CE0DAA